MRYADCTVSSFALTSAPRRISRLASGTLFAHAASRRRSSRLACSATVRGGSRVGRGVGRGDGLGSGAVRSISEGPGRVAEDLGWSSALQPLSTKAARKEPVKAIRLRRLIGQPVEVTLSHGLLIAD